MPNYLPQKYQAVARDLIPYTPAENQEQIALIAIDPAMPCFLCGGPAMEALLAAAPKQVVASAWLMFPICDSCQERQIQIG